jgi:hypothetical protein
MKTIFSLLYGNKCNNDENLADFSLFAHRFHVALNHQRSDYLTDTKTRSRSLPAEGQLTTPHQGS